MENQVWRLISIYDSIWGHRPSMDSAVTGGCLSASLTFSLMFQTPSGMSYPGCISLRIITAALLPSAFSISPTASLAA